MSNPRVESNGSVYNGVHVNTPYESEKDKGVKVDDFLNLMVAQLSNQDFMNPVDDTQYITQMAQFATMQSMQELSHYSQNSYVAGLVGKNVTVASLGVGGSVSKDSGIVSSVNITGDGYTITVNGKQYELSQIMSIADPTRGVTQGELNEAGKMSPIITGTTENSAKLRWDPPKESADDELSYSVYYTTDPDHDMNSLSGVKKATLEADDITDNQIEISGLKPGTEYYVNVIVRNKAGEESLYQSIALVTDGEAPAEEPPEETPDD